MASSVTPFPLRMPTEVHERAARAAEAEGMSLNFWITTAVLEKLERTPDGDQ